MQQKLNGSRRQLSGSKQKMDPNQFKIQFEEVERQRPGSGQPVPILKSPLPPRKPVFSGQEKHRILVMPQQQDKTYKSQSNTPNTKLPFQPQYPSQQIIQHQHTSQIVQHTSQIHQPPSQLPLIKSPLKSSSKKPPIQQDKKPVILRQPDQKMLTSVLFTIMQNPQRMVKSVDKIKENSMGRSLEKQISPNFEQKQFTWNNKIEFTLAPKQISEIQKVNIKNNKKRRPQPSTKKEFTMTMGRNELVKQLEQYQELLRDVAKSVNQEYNPLLNMSEIQEQSEDGQSMQSTLYQQFHK